MRTRPESSTPHVESRNESERGKLAPMVSCGQAKDGFGDLLWALLSSAEFMLER